MRTDNAIQFTRGRQNEKHDIFGKVTVFFFFFLPSPAFTRQTLTNSEVAVGVWRIHGPADLRKMTAFDAVTCLLSRRADYPSAGRRNLLCGRDDARHRPRLVASSRFCDCRNDAPIFVPRKKRPVRDFRT